MMANSRKRPLTESAARAFKSFLDNQIAEHKGSNPEIRLYENNVAKAKWQEVSVRNIQDISMNEAAFVTISFRNPETADSRVVTYSGESPYNLTVSDSQKGVAELYMDEIYDMASRNQYQSQKQQQSQKSDNEHVTQLVGVSKNSLRFRQDKSGSKWVNVAVPWAASKNGLGNLDIPRKDFDKANTPEMMAKRSTYHVPLKQQTYGLWYIDKATGEPCKPTVETDKIYQAYEENRSAYRAARITSATKDVEEKNAPVESPDFALDDIDFC